MFLNTKTFEKSCRKGISRVANSQGNPESQGINLLVSKTLEMSGTFTNTSWESGKNWLESCLGEYHSHSVPEAFI